MIMMRSGIKCRAADKRAMIHEKKCNSGCVRRGFDSTCSTVRMYEEPTLYRAKRTDLDGTIANGKKKNDREEW
jgi:hypothetical protein